MFVCLFVCFFLLGVLGGLQIGLGHNLLMQLSSLNSAKMQSSETDSFFILTIQTDQISYVRHVLAALYVCFRPPVLHPHLVRLFEPRKNHHAPAPGGPFAKGELPKPFAATSAPMTIPVVGESC